MKHDFELKTKRVSFCSASSEVQKIEIAGQVLIPNEDTAYVEFYLSHALPVVNAYKSAVHPRVVANSYQTLNHKVFNLAHLIRSYDPENNPVDRILGTVVAVEFTGAPQFKCACGDCVTATWGEAIACPKCGATLTQANAVWQLMDEENAPGIRAVAAIHKAAQYVVEILTSWFAGKTPMGGVWSVSIENQFQLEDCGFLVNGRNGLESFVASTPAELSDLGMVYVPSDTAPEKLLNCMNNDEDDARDNSISARIVRDYKGQKVILLLGGLDGRIRYRGVGLTSSTQAREKDARVSQMLASEPMVDVASAMEPLNFLGTKIFS